MTSKNDLLTQVRTLNYIMLNTFKKETLKSIVQLEFNENIDFDNGVIQMELVFNSRKPKDEEATKIPYLQIDTKVSEEDKPAFYNKLVSAYTNLYVRLVQYSVMPTKNVDKDGNVISTINFLDLMKGDFSSLKPKQEEDGN